MHCFSDQFLVERIEICRSFVTFLVECDESALIIGVGRWFFDMEEGVVLVRNFLRRFGFCRSFVAFLNECEFMLSVDF